MLNVVGIGPGNPGYITENAREIINKSDILIGGKRNLEMFPEFKGEKIKIGANLSEIVKIIEEKSNLNISVIASGDPSIYGIGKYMSEHTDRDNMRIIPGISSMQYMFSVIKVDMNDLYITSGHGREPDYDYILSHSKICMVTDKKNGPERIAEEIIKRNQNRIMAVGENLSYDNERITIGRPEEIVERKEYDMNVVVILNEK